MPKGKITPFSRSYAARPSPSKRKRLHGDHYSSFDASSSSKRATSSPPERPPPSPPEANATNPEGTRTPAQTSPREHFLADRRSAGGPSPIDQAAHTHAKGRPMNLTSGGPHAQEMQFEGASDGRMQVSNVCNSHNNTINGLPMHRGDDPGNRTVADCGQPVASAGTAFLQTAINTDVTQQQEVLSRTTYAIESNFQHFINNNSLEIANFKKSLTSCLHYEHDNLIREIVYLRNQLCATEQMLRAELNRKGVTRRTFDDRERRSGDAIETLLAEKVAMTAQVKALTAEKNQAVTDKFAMQIHLSKQLSELAAATSARSQPVRLAAVRSVGCGTSD